MTEADAGWLQCSGAHGEYADAVEVASRLDAVVKARASGELMPRAAGSVSKAFWLYQCTLQPFLFKALAMVMAILSAAIVWSESTLRFDWVNLSPLAAVRCHHLGTHVYNVSSGSACEKSDDKAIPLSARRLFIKVVRVQLKSSCS